MSFYWHYLFIQKNPPLISTNQFFGVLYERSSSDINVKIDLTYRTVTSTNRVKYIKYIK